MHSLTKNGSWIVLLAVTVGCSAQLTGGSGGGGGPSASGGAGAIGGSAGAGTGGGVSDGGSDAGGAGGVGGADGTVGWPDGGVDVASGCDEAVAAQTLADLGIVITSTPHTGDQTLPPGLTGPEWDLKAKVCKDGGYDISALGGSTVCILGADITQLCQGYPARVYVIMSGGTTACVFKTLSSSSSHIVPGVYTASDCQ
jgi:hypothetical protein